MTFNYSSEDIKDIQIKVSAEPPIPKLSSLDLYFINLEKRIQRLEADLKRREDIENAPARYED